MPNIQEIKRRFEIIGNNEDLNRAIDKSIQIAPTDISVLITGESGVGKESIPKIIHQLSHRKHGPYIAVNCGAIPEGTIDSELFGHEKGSFTGATNTRKGYFEEADGGTIFLDEVGELPLTTQVRLLRVLETGEFIKVGSSKIQKTNVRIVAATNLKMLKAVSDKKFREDLYYRLNTVEISLPPLRERKDDIHLLFRKFASDFAEKYRMPVVRLTPESVTILENYSWPGNIRQLRNITEQVSVVESSRLVESEILTKYIPDEYKNNMPVASSKDDSFNFEKERNMLYSILFDLRHQIDDVKKLVVEFLKENSNPEFYEKNHQLISKIFKGDQKAEPANRETNTPALLTSGSHYPIVSLDEQDEEEDFDNSMDKIIDIEESDNLSLVDKEIELIKLALEKNRGKRKDAANELGISERTLYRKIKQYNL